MIITELEHKRKRYLVVFITLSDTEKDGVAGWIKDKIKLYDGISEGENLKYIKDLCEAKFGERPHIIERKDINKVKI